MHARFSPPVLVGFSVLIATAFFASVAAASPITFAADADYNNGVSQTTGLFRDYLDGGNINRGLDLGGTGHTALNFTGTDNNAPFNGAIALYDINPVTAAPTLFSGDRTMSADILIHQNNNSKGAGLLTLFTEGAGEQGLALFLADAGNTDKASINLVSQTGVSSSSLGSVALGSGILLNQWYRLVLTLDQTGSNFTITGSVFSHTTGSDPNSALFLQIGSTLTYNGSLSATLSDPYEIGVVSRGNLAVRDTSVTNFCVDGCIDAQQLEAVPEPATIALLGLGLAAIGARKLRGRKR